MLLASCPHALNKHAVVQRCTALEVLTDHLITNMQFWQSNIHGQTAYQCEWPGAILPRFDAILVWTILGGCAHA